MNDKKTSRGVRGSRGAYGLYNIQEDEELDVWQRLAFGIIAQALADARKVCDRPDGELLDSRKQLLTTRSDLELFFNGRWCATLLHNCDTTGPELARRVGL